MGKWPDAEDRVPAIPMSGKFVRLVLLPGMDGTGELFAPFLAALGERRAMVTVMSYPHDSVMGYPELADWVAEQLPAEDFVLLGESFSGPVAALVAGMHPAGLRGLILCATFVRNPRSLTRGMSLLTYLLPISRSWARLSVPWLIGLRAPRALRDLYVDSVGGMSSKTMQTRLRSVLHVDVSEALGRVDVPVLYLRATRDRLVPPAAGEWVKQSCSDVRITDVDAPHGMLQASPVACVAAIKHFIAGL